MPNSHRRRDETVMLDGRGTGMNVCIKHSISCRRSLSVPGESATTRRCNDALRGADVAYTSD